MFLVNKNKTVVKLFIPDYGINENIYSFKQSYTSFTPNGITQYHNTEFDISFQYNDFLAYKLKHIYCDNKKNNMYILDIQNKYRIDLTNTFIKSLEIAIDGYINIAVSPDYYQEVTGEELMELEIALRKDKIKKLLIRIKNES